MNKISKFFLVLIILVVAFTLGYKMGDANGYSDGYKVGYLYDCKAEISLMNDQVQAQSKALVYTDSALKRILRENDSLKRKEYYQKRYNDSLKFADQFSKDSLRYSKIAKEYADSLNLAVGGHIINIVQADGRMNRICSLLPKYRELRECKDGFDLRSLLDEKLKKPVKRRKKK